MIDEFDPFASWNDVVRAALSGERIWYKAALDRIPRSILVVKVFKNGNIRIDPMSSGIPNFTANKGHLGRFYRRGDPGHRSPADLRRDIEHATGVKVR